jgi:lipoyl(octanoyl) transferase
VSPWLADIYFFDDIAPHPAAVNMAMDEALLGVIPGAVLRVYRWERPAVSFGYFERWEPIQAAHPEREAMRRWTGGGVVLHGEDLTYSLLIPAGGERLGPAECYRVIHEALCGALREIGVQAYPTSNSQSTTSNACFENPVRYDVLVEGRKVAGAAQRRTRGGLIHQGSIQSLELPPDFGLRFASCLAGRVRAWLEKRP